MTFPILPPPRISKKDVFSREGTVARGGGLESGTSCVWEASARSPYVHVQSCAAQVDHWLTTAFGTWMHSVQGDKQSLKTRCCCRLYWKYPFPFLHGGDRCFKSTPAFNPPSPCSSYLSSCLPFGSHGFLRSSKKWPKPAHTSSAPRSLAGHPRWMADPSELKKRKKLVTSQSGQLNFHIRLCLPLGSSSAPWLQGVICMAWWKRLLLPI